MGLMNVLSANRTSKPASLALFFSRSTAVPQMLLEVIMTTGCLRIQIQISFECLSESKKSKKDMVPNRVSSEDADRKHTPLRALETVPNAFFYCQINVRFWQITGKYVSFTFQKWTDLGHVLPNCGQCFPIC